ncbi:HEAT repeat domain-containing protein [Actinomadura sediminis]|uniref:HEAT repeat domain-containing protein n=1 Tax=Actinomadura sediminis TaxID=1038904 RepID=A0ABW3EVW0_9ACTN
MIEERLARVTERLQALRADGDAPAFGPPLPEERVAAFEELNGIRLPDAYRRFVTTIGNGGPGPYEGLRALDVGVCDPRLSGEFPYGPGDLPGRWRRETAEWRYWTRYRGSIPLARQHDIEWEYHETAEPESRLVLSGPGRGRVVLVDASHEWFPPIYHPAPDFLAWYEEWLDDPSARRYGSGSDFDRLGWSFPRERDDSDQDEVLWATHVYAARTGNRVAEQALPADCRALAEMALDAPSPHVRAAAAWALPRVRRDVGRYSLPLLRARDARVRRIAVRSVVRSVALPGAAEFAKAESALRPLLAEQAPELRSAALEHAEAAAALRPLLADPDPEVRAAAAAALGADHVLAGLLADPGPRARAAALDELPTGSSAPDDRRNAVAAARPLLRDPDPDVRAAAVATLGLAHGDVPWIEPMLHAALTDPAVPVRRAAARHLLRFAGRSARPRSVPVLLADPDPVIRYETLYRLGLGTARAMAVPARYWAADARELMRGDPDPQVRAGALVALVEAEAPPPAADWARLLDDLRGAARDLAMWGTLRSVRRGEPPGALRPGGPVHEVVHRALGDRDGDRRSTAVHILGKKACAAECRPVILAALAAEEDDLTRYSLGRILDSITPGGTPAGP